MLLTIFTPTYNRVGYLSLILVSLKKQTFLDFEWLIIDDGSTDNTDEVVARFMNESTAFPIKYIYKSNGGKHTAINLAAKEAKGDYILWLDSDDAVLPDSLVGFSEKLIAAKEEPEISAVVGLRLGNDYKPLGSYIPVKDIDVYFLPFTQKYRVEGDYSWAIKKDVLAKYPFPVFENEKFCTEGLVLNRISQKYMTRFVNIPVIIGSYIEGGLTARLHELTRSNPLGYLAYYKEIVKSKQSLLKNKIRNTVLYWAQVFDYKNSIPQDLAPTVFMRLLKYPSYMIYMIYRLIHKKR